jgi:hypothetical protein
MSSIIRSLVTGGLMAVLALAAMAAPVQAQTPAERQAALRKAARAAIYGPAVKLKVSGHEYTVKEARMNSNRGIMTIQGQISHHLSLRPDDQLFYTIEKADGKVLSVRISISRGGLAPVVAYLAGPISGGTIESVLSLSGQALDDYWESAARLMVTSIALRAPDSFAAKRAGAAPYQPKSGK